MDKRSDAIPSALTFVHADVGHFTAGRPSPARACSRCRRAKKRCSHAVRSSDNDRASLNESTVLQAYSPAPPANVQSPVSQDESGRPSKVRKRTVAPSSGETGAVATDEFGVSQPDKDQYPQFRGALEPQIMLSTHRTASQIAGQQARNNVGVWLAQKSRDSSSTQDIRSATGSARSPLYDGLSPSMRGVVIPLLEEECLRERPSEDDIAQLLNIFDNEMQPIFPIVDRSSLDEMSFDEPDRILLVQGVSLLASMNNSSRPFLRLPSSTALLTQREFGSRIHTAMRFIIELGLVEKPVVLSQVLAMMSLFVEGQKGRDKSTQLCAVAIQHVYSLGLHHSNRPSGGRNGYAVRLLCCMWALDRLNAAFHGKPVLMHERDFSIDIQTCIQGQNPCFQLFLRVVTVLDKVIDLYRPHNSSAENDWEVDFPSFEHLITKSNAVQVPLRHLGKSNVTLLSREQVLTIIIASIETLYHATSMLSRRARSWDGYARESNAFLRQTFSALRVPTIVNNEFRYGLPCFPYIPYALLLSTSVAYCEMRQSKVSLYRVRAQKQFRNNCSILRELGAAFWAAAETADVGDSMFRELEKAFATMSAQRSREMTVSGLDDTAEDLHPSALSIDRQGMVH